MSALDAADISHFKALQWSLEEKYDIGAPVQVLLTLPEAPSQEALERFCTVLRAWTAASGNKGKVKWNSPILEVHLSRPPRKANLAEALERAVEELGMLVVRAGYR